MATTKADGTRAFRARNVASAKRSGKPKTLFDATATAESLHTVATGDGRTLVCAPGVTVKRMPPPPRPVAEGPSAISFEMAVFGSEWK